MSASAESNDSLSTEWSSARTFTDLGELTARWLEGDLASQPGYEPGCGPDDETAALIPTLAAVNRGGYCTTASQPALAFAPGYDGATWGQRAAVEGWAEPGMRDRLADAAGDAGLFVVVNRIARRLWRRRPGVVVTTREGKPYTQFGVPLDRRDVRTLYDGCHEVALTAVANAAHVTIADPVWGRNDVLWSVLDCVNGLSGDAR